MKLFEKINEVLGFTPSERRVILLLIAAFLAGWGIKWYKESFLGQPAFDYSAVDSEFTARSGAYTSRAVDSSRHEPFRGRRKKTGARSAAKVNINTASKDELVGLPGIGDAMAERIILYREDHGPFGSVEGLGGVKGIGKKKLQRLIPLCTTEK